MQEAEDQDTCRICSAPGEQDQPLFHPCKCSGTIRYIHQDCLTTWLSHSKKKTCDVCKHPYSFTKVYASDMPTTLPPLLLVRRLAQQALFTILFGLRAIVIAVVWLAILPLSTIWTWRLYFTMGESTAWWISGRERQSNSSPVTLLSLAAGNESISLWRNTTVLQQFTTRPSWQTLSADMFAGQIIASLIVLIFVAVFLLREWISQNARPGMFEEEELVMQPPADPPVLEPLPVAQAPAEPNGRFNQAPMAFERGMPDMEEARRQPRVFRGRHEMGQNPQLLHAEDVERIRNLPNLVPPTEISNTIAPAPPVLEALIRVDKGKAREGDDIDDGGTVGLRRRIRRRLDSGMDESDSAHESDTLGAVSDSHQSVASTSSTVVQPTAFEFTFRAPLQTNGHAQDTGETSLESLLRPPAEESQGIRNADASGPKAVPHQYAFHPATTRHVFSSPSPSPSPSPELAKVVKMGERGTSDGPSLVPLFKLDGTHAAHEEFAAGSSSGPTSSTDGKRQVNEDFRDEFNHYFREKGPASSSDEESSSPATEREPIPGVPLAQPVAPPAEEDEENEEHDNEAEGEDLGDRDPWDADGDDDGDDDDDDEPVNRNPVNRLEVQPQQAQVQAALERVNEGGDDMEAGVEDDMEGALEAIGLRGPIFGVVQNAVLMILVLDTAIGFGVWLPFTLGKTVALLSLDPPRALHILHLPIRAMRVITDPVVDFVTFVLSRLVVLLLSRTLGIVLRAAVVGVDKVAGPSVAVFATDMPSALASRALRMSERLVQWLRSPPEEPSPGLSSHVDKFFESDSAIARFLESHFARFGREVRLVMDKVHSSWVHLTLGHGARERTFAIGLGYMVVAICLALYLNVFTVGSARSAGRAVRNAVRQQLLVVKVAMFIVIELVIFPLGCGIMLDGCTIWVFPEASLQSRVAFFTQAPLTAMFCHWVAGTMFMYQIAILLSGCRTIMRPGAMWFIKDPQDQNFHPIRDILDRPTLTQFRKLLISALMYSMVVACVVGSLAILLLIGSKSIFPIRWKTREPFSDVPIDLLFLQIILPYTMRYLRPRKVLHKASVHVWRFLAARLRLTSYMFGERQANEEVTVRYQTLTAFFRRLASDREAIVTQKDGNFRRVPASDNIALPRDMRATAEVLEDGTPANGAARDLINLQNLEALKAKRDTRADYIVVYFPPRFRARILTFIAAVWLIVAIVVATCIALPVQIGRRCFALFTSAELHDGCSFLTGFYLLWACYAVGHLAERLDKYRLRLSHNGPRPEFMVFFMKRGVLWLSKVAYMLVFLGIVIPTLLGLVVDLYIILPIRLTLDPMMVPKIRIVDMWSLGLIYGKIAIRLRRRIHLPDRLAQALQTLLSNGWSNPDPRHATKELILPLIAGLLGMLAIPAGLVYAVREVLDVPFSSKFLFIHVYPGIFAAAGLSRMCVSAMGVLATWSQAIRDKEFLVAMRLQNHESNSSEKDQGFSANKEVAEEQQV